MPAPDVDPALDGFTVLDFATVGPAARASRVLADYGAQVVKVGAPPRSGGVQIQPAYHAYSGQRGVRQVRIDLKADAGRDVFLDLAETADVIIESFRPGVVERLGVGYDAVRTRNPGIVYCSTSGFGQTGPRAGWAGHDLNYLAVGGYLDCSGRRGDGGPALPGATVADSAAGGMHAAIAILAALVRRQRTGTGTYLDVAVADGVLWLMSLYIDEYLATGEEPGPGHSILTGRYACYDTYQAGDGGWLAVAAIEPQFFANLCRCLGCDEWIPHQTDDDRQDEIRSAFSTAFRQRSRDDWAATLGSADTCVAPVATVAELVDDDQFTARDAFTTAQHRVHGALRQVAPVLAGSERPEQVTLPDWSRTDTDELLRAAGFGQSRIDELREAGVVA